MKLKKLRKLKLNSFIKNSENYKFLFVLANLHAFHKRLQLMEAKRKSKE